MNNETNLLEELKEAKQAVRSCLEGSTTLVNMHGLVYWAERVEKLRGAIEAQL